MEVSGELNASAALFPEEEHPVPIGSEAEWTMNALEKRRIYASPDSNLDFLVDLPVT